MITLPSPTAQSFLSLSIFLCHNTGIISVRLVFNYFPSAMDSCATPMLQSVDSDVQSSKKRGDMAKHLKETARQGTVGKRDGRICHSVKHSLRSRWPSRRRPKWWRRRKWSDSPTAVHRAQHPATSCLLHARRPAQTMATSFSPWWERLLTGLKAFPRYVGQVSNGFGTSCKSSAEPREFCFHAAPKETTRLFSFWHN